MVRSHRRYLWGFFYKGSSYYEFHFPRGRTLMVPLKSRRPHKKSHWYREWGW